jgi:hypothetical protein
MSCILRLFGFRRNPQPPAPLAPKSTKADSQRFSVKITLEGPLPERDYELGILESELIKKIAASKRKSFLAYKNACYHHQKGDMRRYVHYMNEKRIFTETIQKTSARLMQVLEKRNELAYPPPLELPPPKLENEVINPVRQLQNVPNHPPSQMVSTRPVGRSRSHLSYLVPPPPSNLHLRA